MADERKYQSINGSNPNLEGVTTELQDELKRLRTEVEELRDEMADYDNAMLRKFDESAAKSTDLYTYISCLRAKVERLKGQLKEAIELAKPEYSREAAYEAGRKDMVEDCAAGPRVEGEPPRDGNEYLVWVKPLFPLAKPRIRLARWAGDGWTDGFYWYSPSSILRHAKINTKEG